ncbi:MAG: HAD-IC family P-type ATPase, partial [Planctomycetota bacterium]|nr:HAD-IC family P-type ATPase [Planctomycetota bacterium]
MVGQFNKQDHPGLTEEEAGRRLRADGPNELPSTKKRSIAAIVFDVVREPMFLLLVGCGVLYLLLGDLEEALMLLGFVFVIMGITLYQERKTERALEALRDLSSPRALVIRDGAERRIAGREVVVDDVIVLKEGDRVPADVVLLETKGLLVDESLLTGESAAVRKVPATPKSPQAARPGGDDLPFAYSSTLVVQGYGIARVTATGMRTEVGKIGKALQAVESEQTLLQKQTGRLVRNMAFIGISLCAIVVVVYGLTRHNWIDGLLAGITLAMATLPEEFPVVLTIFLALGAWRISRKNVLTRRVPAVENLGSATVLCVDKTGTLTQNQMTVRKMFAGGRFHDVTPGPCRPLPENFHPLVEYSILAGRQDPFDPMEKAIKQLGEQCLSQTEHLHDDWTLVQEYPLSQELLALSHVWRSPDGEEYEIAAKGSPEAIADLCHFSEAEHEELCRQINAMADEGLRVLGVARSRFKQVANLPPRQHDFAFDCLGLIGLVDPIRPAVPQA